MIWEVAHRVVDGDRVLVIETTHATARARVQELTAALGTLNQPYTSRTGARLSVSTPQGGEAYFVSTRSQGHRGYTADLVVAYDLGDKRALDIIPVLEPTKGELVIVNRPF